MPDSAPKTLVVQKYGGSSIATPEKIKSVARRAADEKAEGRDVIVVVSAMGDTTDELISLARTITPNPPRRELDMLLTAGERISMALLSMAIAELGYEAISFTGSQSGIVTDTSHTRAKILDVRAFRVREELEKGKIVIVAGFQGVSPTKEITTLGRGGSDTTAVALAAAFSARDCDIFTDVEGVFTADPRVVPRARKIDKISYEEMLELSFWGADVLHWRSVDVGMRFGVRIHVRSSFGKEMGTIVTGREEIETAQVRAIAEDSNIIKLTLDDAEDPSGRASEILACLDRAEVAVRCLHVSPAVRGRGRVCIVVSDEYRDAVSECLGAGAATGFTSDETVATITIVGQGLSTVPGIARRILDTLRSVGIQPEVLSTSGLSLTLAVSRSRVGEAVARLHSALGLDRSTRSEGRQ